MQQAHSVLRLFFSPQDPNCDEAASFLTDDLRVALQFDHTLWLSGPPNCGKTSLLWTFCQSVAAEGEKSLILASRRRVEAKGGAPLVAASRTSSLWKLVELKWVESVAEAVDALLSVHTMAEVPHVLCIDAVDDLVGAQSPLTELAMLLAALNDARAYCSSRIRRAATGLRKDKGCAALLASAEPLPRPEWTPVVQHWRVATAQTAKFGQRQNSFSIAFYNGRARITIVYTVANGVISLVTAMEN